MSTIVAFRATLDIRTVSLKCSALPVTGYYSYLTTNVVRLRLKTGVMIGDGDAGSVREPSHQSGPSNAVDEAKLKRAVRAHGNFAETAPFAFFLIFLAELNGAPTSLIHGAYATLFLGRVAHGELGITRENTLGLGRPIGAISSIIVTTAAGLYNVSENSSAFDGICSVKDA